MSKALKQREKETETEEVNLTLTKLKNMMNETLINFLEFDDFNNLISLL